MIQYTIVFGNRVIGTPPAVVELDGSTERNTPVPCGGTYASRVSLVRISYHNSPVADAVFIT